MSESNEPKSGNPDLCATIFSGSVAMVGVCLTVIGLFKVVTSVKQVSTLGDDLLALDGLLFLVSALLSYWAMRHRGRKEMPLVEQVADYVFLAGLVLMVVVGALITYAVV